MSTRERAVSVTEVRSAAGVGPCCGIGCPNRALLIVTLDVFGASVTAWVCKTHFEALNGK